MKWLITLLALGLFALYFLLGQNEGGEVKNQKLPKAHTSVSEQKNPPEILENKNIEKMVEETVFEDRGAEQRRGARVKVAKAYEVFKKQNPWLEYKVVEGWAVTQGDVLLGKPQEGDPQAKGRVKASPGRLWPEGVVPFAIQADVPQRSEILAVLDFFNKNTNVRFVNYEGDEDAIVFVKSESLCGSYLGRIGGHQPILIAGKCGFREIAHELMHALGFIHEHSRKDRDQYVKVLWDNIDEEAYEQFAISPAPWMEQIVYTDFEFSYKSIMLYEDKFFAKNSNLITLKSLTEERIDPDKEKPSEEDLARINAVYSL